MDEQPNLREFLNEVSSFTDEDPASHRPAARPPRLEPIGQVVEIAGSGSQIRMDAAALAALSRTRIRRSRCRARSAARSR